MIPVDWTPAVRMDRIIVHWTAGNHIASATDKKAYHLLVEGSGKLVRGVASIAANSGKLANGYAAHTLNCNTNSIGVSMCGMAGAVESPFDAGRQPLTIDQWRAAMDVVAELCRRYRIAVTPKTVLFHAEVQANLGIKQKNKWDVSRLPFDPSVKGAKAIGDMFRSGVLSILGGVAPKAEPDPVPEGARARVIVATAEFFGSPSRVSNKGSLPKGTEVEVREILPDWLHVKTPAGYIGWTERETVEIFDGPPAVAPTTPDPIRVKIAEIRQHLDALEALL